VNDVSQSPEQIPLGEGLVGPTVLERARAAEDEADPRVWVVKTLERAYADDPEEFERYFESLARLEHPHLVEYGDLRRTEPTIQFEQEYFDGVDFLTYVRRAPTLEELETLRRRFDDNLQGRSDGGSAAADPAEEPAEDADESPPAPDTDDDADEETDDNPAGTDTIDPWAKPDESDERNDRSSSGPYTAPDSRSDDGPVTTPPEPLPDVQTYSGSSLADDDSSDVLLDPSDDPEFDEVELLDVVFLRLERLVPQILGALDYLHRFDHPHGDLKPSNILVLPRGRAALVDFGLLPKVSIPESNFDFDASEWVDPARDEDLQYTRAYVAPEVRDELGATPEADLYALGCVLFEAITGCRPFDPDLEDPEQRFDLHASALSELEPRCPSAWVDLVLRLLDPDPEARPDFEEIREVLASSRGRSVDIPPSFVPEQQSFFGRDEVVDQLVDEAEDCVGDSEMRLSLLSGKAGYGKTAMAERLAQWAAQRGWVILRGHCYERDSILYQGWDAIGVQLADICRDAGGDIDRKTDRLRRRAGRLLPALSDDDPDSTPLARLEAVDALRQLLEVVSAERPVLIVLDDLNWATPDTAELLADLLAEPEGLQCHVVGTWRRTGDEPFDHPLVDALESAPVEVGWHDLRGFDDHEAREFLGTVAELPAELRERVLEIGGDNPLVTEELIYQLHLEYAAGEHSDHGEPILEADASSMEQWLTTIVERRLDTLSRREMFVVQLLSVASIPLPEPIISMALEEEFHSAESSDRSLELILDRLRSLRLVRHDAATRWDNVYSLFHNLSRTLVLEDLHRQRLTHLSEHLADAFRRLWPDAMSLRFEFLVRAERFSDALDLALRAARRAESRFAYHRAAGFWRWVADQCDEANRKTTMQPVQELARVERLAGRPERAAELSAELADGLPTGVTRSQHRLRQFESLLEAGRRREALAALDDALGAFGEQYLGSEWFGTFREWKNRAVAATNRWSDDIDALEHSPLGGRQTLRLRLYRHILLKNDLLDSTRGRPFRAKFSAMAEQSKNARLVGYDRLFMALDCHRHCLHGRPNRAAEWYHEATRLLERTDDHCGLAHAAIGQARRLRDEGDFEEARARLDRAAEQFRQTDTIDDREAYLVDWEYARLSRARNDLDRAIRNGRKLRHVHRHNRLARFRANQVLVPVYLWRRDLDRAETLLEECDEFLDDEPMTTSAVWLARQDARLNLALGRPEVARGRLDMLSERITRSGLLNDPYVRLMYHLTRGQVLTALVARKTRIGESRRQQRVREIRSTLRKLRKSDAAHVPSVDAEVARLFARISLMRGNLQEAYEHLRGAVGRLEEYAAPVDRAMCAEAEGTVYERQKEGQGRALVEQAHVVYEHHGCRFPLVLEGWPIPDELSRLRPDESAL
jgi:tetratricopeptide (TPR) repeat protein